MPSKGAVLVLILTALLAAFPTQFILPGMSGESSARAQAHQSHPPFIICIRNGSDIEVESHQ